MRKPDQIAAGKEHGGAHDKKQLVTNSSQAALKPKREPAVRTKIAKQLNVSEHKIQQVMNVDKVRPELLKG